MSRTLCRLTLVDDMAFESSYISGCHGLWVVLQYWMAWPLVRLTVVDDMAFALSYNSGCRGLCFVLR
jgi:hypothetical protein